jgi:hypothetical protein
MAEGLSAVRQEMAGGLSAVRQQMAEGLSAVRQEMAEGLSAVGREMRVLHEDVIARITLLGEAPRRTPRKRGGRS